MNTSAESNAADRAGAYRLQPEGFRAFVPKPLPPSPHLNLDERAIRMLSDADRAVAALDSVILTLPDPDGFVYAYVRKEAVLSSEIEGTQSSLDDLVRAEATRKSTGLPSDIIEVSNYVAAMNLGLERLKELPVSVRLIREVHERLMRGVRGGDRRPGEFRKSQVWIGAHGDSIENATFVPPPWNEVESALADLERYTHSDPEAPGQLPPLVRIGLIHAQFETIHPFHDGNGRIGRLLITLLLCEQKLLRQPVLYLSHFFRANRLEYYERLQAIRDRGDWEGWVRFFLRGVAIVANEAANVARLIISLREGYRNRIAGSYGAQAGKAFLLLDCLFKTPYITAKRAQLILNVSYANANDIIGRLEQDNIIKNRFGIRRNRIFVFDPYLNLFRAIGSAT